ncbi:RNA-guided pseudouridylation complex pseudouridine synthase subunit Cbf5 [Candidatus Woesearchaeota archaeon]|nr:RNA-guided pseudouridylation complex pseudouridine synthase subunit Cbf5 [Candidatus Woesearchaeota archaeon]
MLPFEKEKIEIIFKKPKSKLAKKLKARNAEELLNFGIINADKPADIRCTAFLNKIKKALGKDCGWAGTLDPMVTGVLPIGIGKATRILSVLSKAGKVYHGTMHLHKDVDQKDLQKAFKKFTGVIEQLPPRVSAVKREPRKREIYQLKLIKFKDKYADFEVSCEAGTYIRKLCYDIGEYLGTGAHMTELRRIQSGPLKVKDSVSLKIIKANYKRYLKTRQDTYIKKIILPPEKAVIHLPAVWIEDAVKEPFSHGSPVFAPGIIAFTSNLKKDLVAAIFDQQRNLLGLGIAKTDAEKLKTAQKGLAIKTDVVLIK